MKTTHQAPTLKTRPKVGVALGSGGLKAFAAIPLFEFLDRHGIEVSLLTGSSGGGLLCAGRAVGYNPAQMQQIVREVAGGNLLSRLDFRSILGIVHPRLARAGQHTGILKPQALQKFLRRQFGDLRLENVRPKTRLLATDLETGEPVVLRSGLLADLVYASVACFPLLPPIRIGGRWLADGGFSSPLPVMEAVKRGMDVIIAMDFAEQFTAEPKTFFDFFNRSTNAVVRALTSSQMALSIDLHHHEIISVKARFDRAIQLWDMKEIPYILESGRKAVEDRGNDILAAIDSLASRGREHRTERVDADLKCQ